MRVNFCLVGFPCLAALVAVALVWTTGKRRAESDMRESPSVRNAATDPAPTDLVIEGFGRNTVGGSNGTLYVVTNLNDSGPCSLRDFLNRRGPRIIKFGVSGTIRLRTDLALVEPFITIDGSDAPNGGIAIRGASFGITATQVIIRYVRFREGDLGTTSSDAVFIGEDDGKTPSNVVLDHCSISWGDDGNLDIVNRASDVTIQWCIISENLGPGATLIKYGATRITLHHNLYANSGSNRNPVVQGGDVDVVNNAVYRDFESTSAKYFENLVGIAPDTASARVNFVGNYYKAGSSENVGRADRQKQVYLYGDRAYASQSGVYLQGNIGPSRPDDGLPETDIAEQSEDTPLPISSTRFDHPPVTTSSATTAYNEVLAKAGATLPCRDAVDRRILDYVSTGTARARAAPDPSEVGGWPDLSEPCVEANANRVGCSAKGVSPKAADWLAFLKVTFAWHPGTKRDSLLSSKPRSPARSKGPL